MSGLMVLAVKITRFALPRATSPSERQHDYVTSWLTVAPVFCEKMFVTSSPMFVV